MRRTTLKLHPHPGLPPGISLSSVPSLPHAQHAVWHVGRLWRRFRNMSVCGTGLLAVRTVGVVNLKLAWVGWAIPIVKSLQRNEHVFAF